MSTLQYRNSDKSHLDCKKIINKVWSEYAKKPIDWIQMNPKDRGDFRERVRRETLRGKLTLFHENIETYLTRQARAYTTWRVFAHWAFVCLLTKKCKAFINLRFMRLFIYFP